jgi:hypothetical protein
VQATNSRRRFELTCDGEGVVGHVGAALLVELADRLGLTSALSWRAGRGQTPRHRHDAGAVLRDLVESRILTSQPPSCSMMVS